MFYFGSFVLKRSFISTSSWSHLWHMLDLATECEATAVLIIIMEGTIDHMTSEG